MTRAFAHTAVCSLVPHASRLSSAASVGTGFLWEGNKLLYEMQTYVKWMGTIVNFGKGSFYGDLPIVNALFNSASRNTLQRTGL